MKISKLKEITGQKFGRLTALYRLHNVKGNTKWLCVCECGNLTEVNSYDLRQNHTRSCGCLNKDLIVERSKTHNKSNTKLYSTYMNIKARCYNINDTQYHNYGGRGIKICDEWLNDFQTFYNWCMKNGYNKGLQIDRIDVNGNYEPSNCRWVDMKTQARNKRNNNNITIDGETRCLSEWCEILNLNYKNAWQRIYKYHWTIEKALELEK